MSRHQSSDNHAIHCCLQEIVLYIVVSFLVVNASKREAKDLVCLGCFCAPHQYERWLLFPTVCKTTRGTSLFRSFFSLYAVWFPAKSVFLSGIQNKDTERLQKMLIFFVYKEINYYMLHLLSCLDCCERLEQATREESKLCLIKSRIVKNRGTQRQFSEKYLFGRRFEI